MSYESWISYRYLTAKKDRFVSMISFVAIAGIAIGVMALIVVIGVMTGFDQDLRDKIIGTQSHIVVEKETGLKDFQEVESQLSVINGIAGTTAYINGNIFLESGSRAMTLTVRGVDPATESRVTKVRSYLIDGSVDALQKGCVIIGSELADYFGYREGDTITLIAPASGIKGQGWRYSLKIVGIFNSGMYDYDMNLILVDIAQAQEIFNLPPNVVSGVAVKLNNIYQAEKIKKEVYKALGYSFLVRTWIESNKNFFAALRLEKFAMFIILTLWPGLAIILFCRRSPGT